MKLTSKKTLWRVQSAGFVLGLGFSWATVAAVAADGPAQAEEATAATPAQHPVRQVRHNGIDERVQTLAKALNLDPAQQVALRRVLEGQRESVARVWSDTSMPAAIRIGATQAISDRTADQIRALLTEEQREKYNPPRIRPQDRPARPDVSAWMDVARSPASTAATR
jgi:hypothetical protein